MAILLQLIASGLLLGSLYSLISVGLTLLFGVLRLVNFAHGEFLMLGMYAAYWLHQAFGLEAYLALFVVGPLLFLFGLAVYQLVIKRTMGAPNVARIFATVGLAVVLQNSALALWTGDFRQIQSPFASAVLRLGEVQVNLSLVVAFAITTAVSLALFAFLKWTYIGKAIRATAQDRGAALLMGIDINRVFLVTYATGIALVGIAGALLTPTFAVFPAVGANFSLVAFVVVVLGGMGSIPGALLGGLIVGLVETFSGFYISPALKQAFYFILFILVLAIRPQGLFGQRGAEEFGFK